MNHRQPHVLPRNPVLKTDRNHTKSCQTLSARCVRVRVRVRVRVFAGQAREPVVHLRLPAQAPHHRRVGPSRPLHAPKNTKQNNTNHTARSRSRSRCSSWYCCSSCCCCCCCCSSCSSYSCCLSCSSFSSCSCSSPAPPVAAAAAAAPAPPVLLLPLLLLSPRRPCALVPSQAKERTKTQWFPGILRHLHECAPASPHDLPHGLPHDYPHDLPHDLPHNLMTSLMTALTTS